MARDDLVGLRQLDVAAKAERDAANRARKAQARVRERSELSPPSSPAQSEHGRTRTQRMGTGRTGTAATVPAPAGTAVQSSAGTATAVTATVGSALSTIAGTASAGTAGE